MNNITLHILKDKENYKISEYDNNYTYFLRDEKGCFASFNDKTKLKEYLQKMQYKISNITHINLNLDCNLLPF